MRQELLEDGDSVLRIASNITGDWKSDEEKQDLLAVYGVWREALQRFWDEDLLRMTVAQLTRLALASEGAEGAAAALSRLCAKRNPLDAVMESSEELAEKEIQQVNNDSEEIVRETVSKEGEAEGINENDSEGEEEEEEASAVSEAPTHELSTRMERMREAGVPAALINISALLFGEDPK